MALAELEAGRPAAKFEKLRPITAPEFVRLDSTGWPQRNLPKEVPPTRTALLETRRKELVTKNHKGYLKYEDAMSKVQPAWKSSEEYQLCQTKAAETMPPKKMTLGDFELVRTLGVGSFGRVKYGKYKGDGNNYAVKFMKKHEIIKLKQVDHINGERTLMAQVRHPYIVSMIGSFKDDRYVFIVMQVITGGEMFTHLRKARKFSDEVSKFYGLQVGSAFAFCHSKNIIHRDLKPENLLLDTLGYSKLTDFGFAKVVEPGARTYTLCGTPEYIAPEVLLNKGHGKPVDWWCLGILIYEMIVGQPPFCDEDPMGIYQKILAGKVYFPKYFDKDAKSLVKHLLTADLSKRYGNLNNGAADIKEHRWFTDFSWSDLLERKLVAPIKPAVKGDTDTTNFDDYPDSQGKPEVVPAEKDPFKDW